jgi:hypothetical protein
VGQGTGADERAGFYCRADIKLKYFALNGIKFEYFVFVDAVIFWD